MGEAEQTIQAIEEEYKALLDEKQDCDKRYKDKKESLEKLLGEFDVMRGNLASTEEALKEKEEKLHKNE